MLSAWQKRAMFKVSEQNLTDQARAIKTNKWLSEVELEEIKQQVSCSIGDTDNEIENVTEPSDEPSEDTPGREGGGARVGAFRIVNSEGLSEKQRDILEEIKVTIVEVRGEELRPLKHVDRTKLREATQEINVLLAHVETTDITETNQLLRAAAIVIIRKLGIKRATNHPRKEPFWKRRMKSKIQVLRGEISKLERSRSNPSLKLRGLTQIRKKFFAKKMGLNVVIEELKQLMTAKAEKLRRYEQRVQQYRKNRMFEYDQKKLYKELDGDSSGTDTNGIPDAEESCNIWSNIWDNPIEHNRDADWLTDVRDELSQCSAQEGVKISEVDVGRQLKKVANWKGPGPDGVQGYWLKSFTTLHGLVVLQLNDVLESDSVPQWMNKGRTILCPKDSTIGNAVENFRPINYMPAIDVEIV